MPATFLFLDSDSLGQSEDDDKRATLSMPSFGVTKTPIVTILPGELRSIGEMRVLAWLTVEHTGSLAVRWAVNRFAVASALTMVLGLYVTGTGRRTCLDLTSWTARQSAYLQGTGGTGSEQDQGWVTMGTRPCCCTSIRRQLFASSRQDESMGHIHTSWNNDSVLWSVLRNGHRDL